MRKSVLILMGASGVGGVERVSVVLANEFVARGISVVYCAFRYEETNLLNDLDPRVEIVRLKDGVLTKTNRATLRKVLIDNKITHIMNQWCVPWGVTRFCRKASKGLDIKLYAVHHNIPITNKRIQDATGIKRKMWQLITAINLRLVYTCSDAYVLLSESFVDIFRRFIWQKNAAKVRVITNPLTLAPVQRDKEKLIVYVGRLEETQKRFSRILSIWREVSKMLPDWRLEVVGDGSDRLKYEQLATGLERIAFVGFRPPAESYARAQMLLLTSDFEGFGLVLVEAMASGCVPIVLGSYPAAYDVVKDGGVILKTPYDEQAFVEAISDLANNQEKRAELQGRGKVVSGEYGVKPLVDKWIKLFEE